MRENIPFIELKCWKLKVPVYLARVGQDSQWIKDNKAHLGTDYVIGGSVNIRSTLGF